MVAFDASEMMVEKTANLTGQPAQYMRFDELPFAAEFDGIWTCASLLHVPRQDTKTVWSILLRAMKPGAVWYMSFKEGVHEEIRNGRWFNDQTESSVRATAGVFSEPVIIDVWRILISRADGDDLAGAFVELTCAPLRIGSAESMPSFRNCDRLEPTATRREATPKPDVR